jgi:hypothetical protein
MIPNQGPPPTFAINKDRRPPGPVATSRSVARPTIYRLTDYLFWLMMLTISMPNVLQLFGIDTIFKPYRVLSLILACLAVPVVLNEPPRTRKFSRPLFIAILYAITVTILFGGEYAYAQMPLLVTCLALFFSTYCVTSRKSLLIGLYASVISFILTSAFGAVAFAQGEYRLRGLFGNPNTLGYAGCFALLLAMSRYFPMTRPLRVFLVVGTVPVMILTGSRTAILTMFGTIVSQLSRNNRLFGPLIAVCAALAVGGIFFSDQLSEITRNRGVLERYSKELVEQGGAGRVALIKAGLTVAWESSLVGIGIGQYRLRHHTRFFKDYGTDGEIQRLGTHNAYVTVLAEWGLVGFLCIGTIIVRLLRASRNLVFEKDWIYGFCAATLINGLGNELIAEVHFWVMLGVCIQLIRYAPQGQNINTNSEAGAGHSSSTRGTTVSNWTERGVLPRWAISTFALFTSRRRPGQHLAI